MEKLQAFEEMLESMCKDATHEFQFSDSYISVFNRIEQIKFDWKDRYGEEELSYLKGCINAYRSFYLEEEWFIYQRGIRDAVVLLKQLGVLA